MAKADVRKKKQRYRLWVDKSLSLNRFLNGSFPKSRRLEPNTQGIRSNLVAPGGIKTDMTSAAWDFPAFQRVKQEMTPFNREGTVDDVANAIYFLASKEGSYINGQTIALDGGWPTTKYLCREALVCERM